MKRVGLFTTLRVEKGDIPSAVGQPCDALSSGTSFRSLTLRERPFGRLAFVEDVEFGGPALRERSFAKGSWIDRDVAESRRREAPCRFATIVTTVTVESLLSGRPSLAAAFEI
jgi:hypothetical protein